MMRSRLEIGPHGRGAILALAIGSVFMAVGGVSDVLEGVFSEPALVVLGLIWTTVLGGLLGARIVRLAWPAAIGTALAYAVAVPVLTGASFVLPVAPIGAIISLIAVPVTIAAALVWLVLLRSRMVTESLRHLPISAAVGVLAIMLLVVRITQPVATVSASGANCVGFPREHIDALALSPDGRWLGIASDRIDDSEGVIRILDRRTGAITQIASDIDVNVFAGIAVGPDGEVTYLIDRPDADPDAQHDWSLWKGSPTASPTRLTAVPTPALAFLTYTDDGLVANQWVDPLTWIEVDRVVRVRPDAPTANVFQEVDAAFLLRHPILAPMAAGQDGTLLTISTPSGTKQIPIEPGDADEMTVSRDGRWLVYEDVARGGASDLVARSTTTDEIVVIATEDETWYGHVSSGVAAYALDVLGNDSRACTQDVET